MLFRETYPLVLPLASLPILHHIFTCSSGISVCVPVYWQQRPGISLQWKKYFSEQFGSQCSIVRNVERDESMPRFRFSHVLLTCLALLLCIVGTGAFLSHHIAYASAVQSDQPATPETSAISSDWTNFNLHHSRFNAGEQTISSHNVSRLTLA